MTLVPFAEYAPDRSRFDISVSSNIKNVIPGQGFYKPFKSLVPVSLPLPGKPQGAFRAFDQDGFATIFAATGSKIYRLEGSTNDWVDVSRTGNPYSAAPGVVWSFSQYGNRVVASHKGSNNVQYYDIGGSVKFQDLAGGAPPSGIVGVVGDFLVLAQNSIDLTRMQWSGINNTEHWIPGQKSSDFQIFPDGGSIVGFSGIDSGGVIFQERAIREMIPALDTPFIFTFLRTEENRGALASFSVVRAGNSVYYLSQDGFYKYGRPSLPIGTQRIDDFFFSELDPFYVSEIQGTDEPAQKVAIWRYKSKTHTNIDTSNKLLIYSYIFDKWSIVDQELSFLLVNGPTPALSIDTPDSPSDPDVDSSAPSFDNPGYQGAALPGGFDASFRYGTFSGPALEATFETADVSLMEGRRTKVNGFRVAADTTQATGRVSGMAVHGSPRVWNGSFSARINGMIPARVSSRLTRFEAKIPAGQAWTAAHGIEPEFTSEGRR